MKQEKGITLRYSKAFKLKVVSEIEEGKLTISEARSLYDIKGGATISTWIKKLGRNHLLNKVVRIEMADETKKLKEIEKRNKELEAALADAHLKIRGMEKMLEIVERDYGVQVKKKSGTKVSKK